jgi:mannosyltransferase OCH1-like enzyme
MSIIELRSFKRFGKRLTSRSMRLVVALIISLVLLSSFYAGWNPTHALSSPEMTAIGDIGSKPPVPLKLKSHSSSTNTSIHDIPDKVWHSAKDDHISEKQREWVNSWTDTNPTFRQELLTDRSGEAFVRARYHETISSRSTNPSQYRSCGQTFFVT